MLMIEEGKVTVFEQQVRLHLHGQRDLEEEFISKTSAYSKPNIFDREYGTAEDELREGGVLVDSFLLKVARLDASTLAFQINQTSRVSSLFNILWLWSY